MEALTTGAASPGRAWWGVFILFLAYMLSYIDRTIIALMVEPLRQDLGLTDVQISLLQGLAFAIFYSTISLPIAILSDRMSRRGIIAIGIAFWSAMTAACGLAGNFWQLFLARMGVGIGEATLGPAAYSLIADLFTEDKRGRAMAIFSSGVSVGGGLAFILGGMIIAFVATADLAGTPFGAFSGWQLVFLLLGPPGIIVSLLVMTIPEPRNKKVMTAAPRAPAVTPFLKQHALLFSTLFVASAISGMIMTALLYWTPSYLIRVHEMPTAQAGLVLGLGLLIGGPFGAISGGTMSDRWTKQGYKAAPVWTIVIGIALMGLSGIGAVTVSSPVLASILLGSAFFFGSFAYPGGATTIQKSTPPALRARVSAAYLFVVTLFSAAVGPTLIAIITDYVFANPAAVGKSLAIGLTISTPIGIGCALIAASQLRKFKPHPAP